MDTRTGKPVAALLAGLVLLALSTPAALACSCFAPTWRTFSDFDHSFVGTTTAQFTRADLGVAIVGNWFDVEQRFLGAVEDTIEISALPDGNFCGYRYEVGETYLVFADDSDAGAQSGLCRSFPVASPEAVEILKSLGTMQWWLWVVDLLTWR